MVPLKVARKTPVTSTALMVAVLVIGFGSFAHAQERDEIADEIDRIVADPAFDIRSLRRGAGQDGPLAGLSASGLGADSHALVDAAQSSEKPTSATDLAKAYHNPLGSLRALPMQFDLDFNVGESRKTSAVFTFQPIFPIKLNDDWTLVSYTILPVASAPGLTANESRSTGLGDLALFGYLTPAKTKPGHLIWGFGPKLVIPTATDNDLGQDKWSIGPALAIGVQSGNWTAFGLLDNVWSYAGDGAENVNEFNLQYYVTYQFPSGWFAISNLVIEADWGASSGDRWTVPLGGGIGKLVNIGRQPAALYVQAFYNVAAPTDAANWGIIIGFELIFP